MESNSSAGTVDIEQCEGQPPIPPLPEGLDCRLVALIGAWELLPENIKETIHLIAKTSQAVEVEA